MQLCDTFEHNGSRYRITGFMKTVDIPIPPETRGYKALSMVEKHRSVAKCGVLPKKRKP